MGGRERSASVNKEMKEYTWAVGQHVNGGDDVGEGNETSRGSGRPRSSRSVDQEICFSLT